MGTGNRIRAAAIEVFFKKGFHAATMRQMAEVSGIESATIYYHFRNKQALLYDIMRQTIIDLTDLVESRLQDRVGPVDRVKEITATHVVFHCERRAEAAIADVEIDSLEPEYRAEIVNLRDRYEQLLRAEVKAGVEEGLFRTPNEQVATRAILAMSTGIVLWYRPDGGMSLDDLSRQYADLAVRMLTPAPSEAKETVTDAVIAKGSR